MSLSCALSSTQHPCLFIITHRAILPAYGAASYVPALVLERPLYIRERNDGLYRPITYLCFRVIGEGVIAFIVSLITSTIVWFALELQGQWVVFWLAYLTTLIYGIGMVFFGVHTVIAQTPTHSQSLSHTVLAYCIAALSPNIDVANTALPAYVTVQLFFVGLFIPHNAIPEYWRWFSYITPLRYPWGVLMKNQFGGCCTAPFLNGVTVLEYYDVAGACCWGLIEEGFIGLRGHMSSILMIPSSYTCTNTPYTRTYTIHTQASMNMHGWPLSLPLLWCALWAAGPRWPSSSTSDDDLLNYFSCTTTTDPIGLLELLFMKHCYHVLFVKHCCHDEYLCLLLLYTCNDMCSNHHRGPQDAMYSHTGTNEAPATFSVGFPCPISKEGGSIKPSRQEVTVPVASVKNII